MCSEPERLTTETNLQCHAAAAREWSLLTAVRSGNSLILYKDGEPLGDSVYTIPSGNRRYTDGDLTIGNRSPSPYDLPDLAYCFKGNIDEVRIESIAITADRVKLCYMNQREDDKLVEFK